MDKILLAVALLLGALVLWRVAGFLVAAREAQGMAVRVATAGQADTGALDGPLAQAKASAEELRKRNLFVASAPRQHPVSEVIGILGNEALINGQWYKAGDSIADAKVLAVEPTKVRIAWDGQEKDFAPIAAGGAGQPPGRPMPPGAKPGAVAGAQMVVTGGRRGPTGLSAEDRERLRGRWPNMSPEERQRFRDEMRERFGRRDR